MSAFADYIPFLQGRVLRRGAPRKRSILTWQNLLAFVLLCAVLISSIATYAALRQAPPFGDDPDTIIWLLTLDLILLMALLGLVARRIVAIWSGRKRGLAGSHLHVRLVYTFSFMAAVPAVIMTVFSVFFFHYGIQTWFSTRVQTAVNESQAVAQAYLEEHKEVIRADTLAMANDINRQAVLFMANDSAFERSVQTQSILRNLAEALVFDSTGRVLASSGLTFSLEFEEIPAFALEQARQGEVSLMTGRNEDRVRALVKLDGFVDAYLFVGRMVDPQVLTHLAATRQASADYESLQLRSSQLQIMVTMIFIVIGLLLMFAAVWLGFVLARQLVSPISELVTVADRVRAGDMVARVQESGTIEEFDYLARSFNRMTTQIQEQQNELIDANRQMDQRRKFTETILAGVTSGVLGVDPKGRVNLANSSASVLLGFEQGALSGVLLKDLADGFGVLLEQAHARPGKITQGEISVLKQDKTRRMFLVRIAIELVEDRDVGAIVTFDDITDLQSAQRKAAWADVARRIAHEIKNPLTPIQLSAERLKRKYLKEIKSDPDTFSQCTDTIIRHVEDIGRMVNEFSSFARMPEPVMKTENLSKILREVYALHKGAHSNVDVHLRGVKGIKLPVQCDAGQIRQAVNNLIQNAVDSVLMRVEDDPEHVGKVEVLVTADGLGDVVVDVQDNGIGLPVDEAPEHLSEPYVTHKQKGTGLGLAIVKKIMEDHGGSLVLGAKEMCDDGASVSLVLPLQAGKGGDV